MLRKMLRDKKGQALVEYGILIGAVSVVCLASTSLLGHKAGDLIGIAAALLPGDDADDQGAIYVPKLVETAANGSGYLTASGVPGDSGTTWNFPNAGLPGGTTPATGASKLIADAADGN